MSLAIFVAVSWAKTGAETWLSGGFWGNKIFSSVDEKRPEGSGRASVAAD